MTPDEKPQFMKLLSTLFGAHGKPLSEGMIAGYWKGLEKMSLPVFERCCDTAIDKLSFAERGQSKTPTVSELWDIKRGFLGRAPVTVENNEVFWQGDAWDMAANQLLLRHVSTSGKDYAPDAHGNPVQVGPLTIQISKILNKWKEAWARDAREGGADNKANWLHCMTAAENEIAALRVRRAA
jgi:hypothetical protein